MKTFSLHWYSGRTEEVVGETIQEALETREDPPNNPEYLLDFWSEVPQGRTVKVWVHVEKDGCGGAAVNFFGTEQEAVESAEEEINTTCEAFRDNVVVVKIQLDHDGNFIKAEF